MVKSTSQIILSWSSKTTNSPREFSNILLGTLSLDVFLQLPWEQTVAYNSPNYSRYSPNITLLRIIGTPPVPVNEPEISRALERVFSF